ncbi:ATP-grasp domain-containing protein [bacterium]|nr:ATP-grasp domain-containing protein [bacterium]
MFIIEKPYASELLVDTILENDWYVLDNKSLRDAGIEEGAFEIMPSEVAKDYYLKQEYPMIYSNSENAISWVTENLPQSNLASYINFFKDKIVFRELLQKIYPDFYFKAIDLDDMKKLKPEDIKYPAVIKPAFGFLSFGVHTVSDQSEWANVIVSIEKEMKRAEAMYPEDVINSSKYIIEEYIPGDEYAIDAYYDRNGNPVILNIFQHPLMNESDVRDRIYLTSAEIMIRYMAKFDLLLKQIGEIKDVRNFPFHAEVRVTDDGKIIPIEINPMRFAGWCTTDIAKYAWGINVYEYFYRQINPNWNEILSDVDSKIYYFSMAEVPSDVSRDEIQGFDYDKYLANYSNVVELRRIHFKQNPLFAVIFGYTNDKSEIDRILQLNTRDFIL